MTFNEVNRVGEELWWKVYPEDAPFILYRYEHGTKVGLRNSVSGYFIMAWRNDGDFYYNGNGFLVNYPSEETRNLLHRLFLKYSEHGLEPLTQGWVGWMSRRAAKLHTRPRI